MKPTDYPESAEELLSDIRTIADTLRATAVSGINYDAHLRKAVERLRDNAVSKKCPCGAPISGDHAVLYNQLHDIVALFTCDRCARQAARLTGGLVVQLSRPVVTDPSNPAWNICRRCGMNLSGITRDLRSNACASCAYAMSED